MTRMALFVAGSVCVVLAGCPSTGSGGKVAPVDAAPPMASVATAAPPPSASGLAAQIVEPEDDVRPVYPSDAGPPNPLAQRFCAALHDVPEQRRATCCKEKPGLVVTSECV